MIEESTSPTHRWWLQLDPERGKKYTEDGKDGWGLGPGEGHGVEDDGGSDQFCELVLGMRPCAQSWEHRGE